PDAGVRCKPRVCPQRGQVRSGMGHASACPGARWCCFRMPGPGRGGRRAPAPGDLRPGGGMWREESMTKRTRYILVASLVTAGMVAAAAALLMPSRPAVARSELEDIALGQPSYGGTGCPEG